MYARASTPLVIPGQPAGLNPESIKPRHALMNGFRALASRAPRCAIAHRGMTRGGLGKTRSTNHGDVSPRSPPPLRHLVRPDRLVLSRLCRLRLSRYQRAAALSPPTPTTQTEAQQPGLRKWIK